MDTKIENKKVVTDELKHQNHGAGKQQQQQPLIMCSPTSSPSHEFSFTIPLMNSSSTFANKNKPPTTTTPCLSTAVAMEDLSPADDIFFHGHLLPLHLLSHVPISPRNSLDIFTLPIQDLPPHQNQTSNNINNNKKKKKDDELDTETPRINNIRPKAKSFSIFGRSKWRKQQENENGEKEREKKKPKFEVSQMIKRYMRMVRPLLSMKSSSKIIRGGGNGGIFKKQEAYSFSGNVSLRHDENDSSFESSSSSTRRREFSAPASMWTSPSNSGILMSKGGGVGGGTPSYSSSTDSTMEELQAAIQAAITHCKNSIAIEDNTKIP